MEKVVKKRDESLDIAKGVLIFLVVWAHSIQFGFGYEYGESYQCLDDYVFRAICSFHMPLFMAISGYLYYYSNRKTFKEVIVSRLKSIGIPYLAYCTLNVLLMAPMMKVGGAEFILSTYKNGFWFLTSVLLNCLVVSIVTLISRKKWVVTAILLLINLGLFFVNDNYLYNTHNYMFTCFIVGYLYNLHFEKPMTFSKTSVTGGVISIIVFLASVSIFKGDLYIYSNGVYLIRNGAFSIHQLGIDMTRCAIGLVVSICFLYFVPLYKYMSERMQNLICTLGRYSIGIYCLSMIILHTIYKVMGRFDINISHNYYYPIALAIFVVTICTMSMKFCEKRKILNILFLGGR